MKARRARFIIESKVLVMFVIFILQSSPGYAWSACSNGNAGTLCSDNSKGFVHKLDWLALGSQRSGSSETTAGCQTRPLRRSNNVLTNRASA
jgi:hypothetical protein